MGSDGVTLSRERAQEGGVAEGEDPAVRAHQEVALVADRRHHAHDVVHVDWSPGSEPKKPPVVPGGEKTKTPPSEPTMS